MKQELLVKVLQNKTYQVPSYLINNYQELNIKTDYLPVLIYLINQTGIILYNPKAIAKDLNTKDLDILSTIHDLQELGIIKVELTTNGSNKKVESLNLEPLYSKLSDLIINSNLKKSQDSIFKTFEKEFARTLSPMEYEIINSWLEAKMDQELIIAALKEAIFNGVSNLRYIDKILYEWHKSGIKKTTDLKTKKPQIKKEELFDYNWLEE